MVARRLTTREVELTFNSGADISFPVHSAGDCAVVVASGEIDIWTCPALQQALDAAMESSKRVIVDLTDVTFLDSSGLAVLLRARTHGLQDGAVPLAGAGGMVRRVLTIGGVSGEFHFYDSVDEATELLA